MKVNIEIPFEPFDRQADALLSDSSITACVSGARGGKTKVGSFMAVMWGIEQPGYLDKDVHAKEPYVILIGAPTFPMLYRIIVPAVIRMIPQELIIGKYHETKKQLRIHGRRGQTVYYFLSGTNVSSWYGLKPYRVWLDEFAVVKEELFDEIQARLVDTRGKSFFTGTPQGPNWAHKRIYVPWTQGSEQISFHTWKTVDNPYISREEIEEKRRTMPKRYFERTFCATWDTFEGQVYEEFLEAVHCRPRANYTFHLPNGRRVGSGPEEVYLRAVVGGVDWGYGQGHAGAFLVLGKDTTGRWWVLEESVAEHLLKIAEPLADSWLNRARSLSVKWGIQKIFCDTEDPEAIAQFRRAGLPAQGAVKEVLQGIECVARFLHVDDETIEPRLIVISDCRITSDEFTYYHWKEGSAKEQPDKINDNTMDALRYGIYTYEIQNRLTQELSYGRRR